MGVNVSIVIPSLNVKPYIQKCMESVVSQTLAEVEIICVDAGSTDGTLEMLKEYAVKDSRIKLIHSDKRSYGYQMNLGIKKAKGEYVAIVESDDFIDLSVCQKMYQRVENSNVDFIKGGYFEYSDMEGGISLKCIKKRPEQLSERIINLQENRALGMIDLTRIWAALYRRDFLVKKDIKFNETPGASFQDISFSVLVGLLAEQCIYSNDCFYYYRIDNENSSVKSEHKYHCVIDEYQYIQEELVRHNINTLYNKYLVLKQKLENYQWNYLRLSGEVREKFFVDIQDEMLIYKKDVCLCSQLNDEQKEALKLLTVSSEILEYQDKQNDLFRQMEQLINSVLCGNRYVIVGIGQYGERFLLLQKILRVKYIEAICDNSITSQGEKKSQYMIQSVEEAVSRYKNNKFIIANKNHSDDIYLQLKNLGVNEEEILIFNKMISTMELIQLCKSIMNK